MIRTFLFFAVLSITSAVQAASLDPQILQGGDILLQKTTGGQSTALAAATESPYTHSAMVFMRKGKPVVLEAVGPVKWTPLHRWVRGGENEHVVVLRLKDEAPLANGGLEQLERAAVAYLGRPYDTLFQWSDQSIYCSELVFKAYQAALKLEIGAKQPLSSFNLKHPAVQYLIHQRVQGHLNTEELIVSPVSLLHDDDLKTVFSNDPDTYLNQ